MLPPHRNKRNRQKVLASPGLDQLGDPRRLRATAEHDNASL